MQPTSSYRRKPVQHPRKAMKHQGRVREGKQKQPQAIWHPIFGMIWLFAK